MDYYTVHRGEGIAGPMSKVAVSTSTLYSCMGIQFHNVKSNVAGLYHYSADSIDHPKVVKTLVAMINHIKPHRIILTPADNYDIYGKMGSSDLDIAKVVEFLEKIAQLKISKQEPSSRACYAMIDGKLTYQYSNTLPWGREGIAAFENVFQAESRELPDMALYFGVNGESSDALAPKPKPSKGKCNIL